MVLYKHATYHMIFYLFNVVMLETSACKRDHHVFFGTHVQVFIIQAFDLSFF